jgi:hypothetical protein
VWPSQCTNQSLFLRSAAAMTPFSTNYEIRKYGTRFAIETDYSRDNTGNAFRSLAGYICVGGAPQNEGSASISMTAPVATSPRASPASAQIAMTSPVVTSSSNNGDDSKGVMQFISHPSMVPFPRYQNHSTQKCEYMKFHQPWALFTRSAAGQTRRKQNPK